MSVSRVFKLGLLATSAALAMLAATACAASVDTARPAGEDVAGAPDKPIVVIDEAAVEQTAPLVSPTPRILRPIIEGDTESPGGVEPAANGGDGAAGVPPAIEAPRRFCVDHTKVDSTLNLRSGPSLDSSVLISIPRLSCELIATDSPHQQNYAAVLYATQNRQLSGWVSLDFVVDQDPPTRTNAAALLFVDAWLVGSDTEPYSFGIEGLGPPYESGTVVLADGPEGHGCVLVGDVTLDCSLALVSPTGETMATLRLGAAQRGNNGYDGSPYFEDEFPDGPRVISFSVDYG